MNSHTRLCQSEFLGLEPDEVAQVVEVLALGQGECGGEYSVDFGLHRTLKVVPNQAPAQLGLDVADQFRADLDVAQRAQLAAEVLGGADVLERAGPGATCGRTPCGDAGAQSHRQW